MESVTKHIKQVRWSPSCLLSCVFVPSNNVLEQPHPLVEHSVILAGCLDCSPSVCLIALYSRVEDQHPWNMLRNLSAHQSG